jgi:glycerol kinase
MLPSTGEQAASSKHGLLFTLGYRISTQRRSMRSKGRSRLPARSCSGSATTSAFKTSAERAVLAKTVHDSGGVYFVPAFSGARRAVLEA